MDDEKTTQEFQDALNAVELASAAHFLALENLIIASHAIHDRENHAEALQQAENHRTEQLRRLEEATEECDAGWLGL